MAFETVVRHLAANLARLRRERGWTQRQAADAAGIDPKHLQKLETMTANPTLETLARIAEGFGVPAAELLAPTEARPPRRRPGRPKR